MTYLSFHLYFSLPLLLLLGWLARRRFTSRHARWLGVVAVIVLLFTYPWDSSAVTRRIWEFDNTRVAFRIGVLPVEEILFFLIETAAVVLIAVHFLPRNNGEGDR